MSREVDWSDRSSCILFGDGAGAAIMRQEEGKGGLIASVTGSDGSQGDVLTCKGRGIQNPFHQSKRKKDYLRMEGQAVFRFAVTMVPRCIKQILKKTGYLVDGEFVAEQKNLKINFRGSDNQRIIDVKKSLETGEVVHWDGEKI